MLLNLINFNFVLSLYKNVFIFKLDQNCFVCVILDNTDETVLFLSYLFCFRVVEGTLKP